MTRGLLIGLLRVARKAELDLACVPHLMHMYLQLDGRGPTPPRGAWLDLHMLLRGVVELFDNTIPGLIEQYQASGPGAEQRVHAAIVYLLETVTRNGKRDEARFAAIAGGTLELATALRATELEVLDALVATASAQLEAAVPVEIDPGTLAELSSMDQLVAGDLVIPVPEGARPVPAANAFLPKDGVVSAAFAVQDTPSRLYELYRAWAHCNGWLIELVSPDPRLIQLRLARGAQKFDVFAHGWINGDAMLSILVRTTEEARFAPASVFGGPPSTLPVVTRPRPLATTHQPRGGLFLPKGLLVDRGAILATERNALWFVDPATKLIEPVFVRASARLHGLALIGDDALVVDTVGELLRVDLQRGSGDVVASDLPEPTHVAVLGSVAYVVCQPTHIRAIDLASGATIAELVPFPALDKIRALIVDGDALVAVDHRYLVSIDRHANSATRIAEIRDLSGVASDGTYLYASVWGGIDRIDRQGRRRQLVGRKPDSDPLKAVVDGCQGAAFVAAPTHLAYDGNRLFFLDRSNLRWLDLSDGQVTTICTLRY